MNSQHTPPDTLLSTLSRNSLSNAGQTGTEHDVKTTTNSKIDLRKLSEILNSLSDTESRAYMFDHRHIIADIYQLGSFLILIAPYKHRLYGEMCSHVIKDHYDLRFFLANLPLNERLATAEKFQDRIVTNYQLESIARTLSTNDRFPFVEKMKNKVEGSVLNSTMMQLLPEEQRHDFFELNKKNIVKWDLSEIMRMLSPEHSFQYLQSELDEISSRNQVVNIMDSLPESKRLDYCQLKQSIRPKSQLVLIMELMKHLHKDYLYKFHHITDIIADYTNIPSYTDPKKPSLHIDLTRHISSLSDNEALEFSILHKDIIRDIHDLIYLLNRLPSSIRREFAEQCENKIPSGYYFLRVISTLPETDRLSFALKHIDRIDNPISDYKLLLSLLPVPQKSEIPNLSQDHLNKQFVKFSSKYQKKYEFSQNLINHFTNDDGFCSGYAARFLVGAHLEQLKQEKQAKLEIKNLETAKHHPPRDDLTFFRFALETISSWDGNRELSDGEQWLFCTILYQIYRYQRPEDFQPDQNVLRLHEFIVISTDSKMKEVFSTGACATQVDFEQLLKDTIKPHCMNYLASHNHAIAIYQTQTSYLFYDPNNPFGWIELPTLTAVAASSFQAWSFIPTRRSPVRIYVFRFINETELKDENEYYFPTQTELLEKIKAGEAFTADKGYADGLSPLLVAGSAGNTDALEYYLKHKHDPTIKYTNQSTLLMSVSDLGYTKSVDILLCDARIDPNAKFVDGRTALHIASERGHVDIVRRLLKDERVDPTLRSMSGKAPIDLATDPIVMNLLLSDARINPNTPSDSGNRPLNSACISGNIECARSLMNDPRTNPNLENKFDGKAPIHNATEHNHPSIVKLLLEKGAHRLQPIKDPSPSLFCCFMPPPPTTALTLAINNKHWECAVLLLIYITNLRDISAKDKRSLNKSKQELSKAFIKTIKETIDEQEQKSLLHTVLNRGNALGQLILPSIHEAKIAPTDFASTEIYREFKDLLSTTSLTEKP